VALGGVLLAQHDPRLSVVRLVLVARHGGER